jgi:hypothetical protein
LQFEQSVTNEEHDGVEQLNPDTEVRECSESTAIDNKSIEDVSSVPIAAKKDDEVLAVIGDGSVYLYKVRAHSRFEFLIPFVIL